MEHPEKNTINAINELRDKYPYAASMLIFILIERELKKYVIKHRFESSLQKEKVKIRCQYVSVRDLNKKDDECFLKEFISKITLGSVEKILKIKKNDSPSKLRNELMHSKEYLLCEHLLEEQERIDKNREKYEQAKQYLIKVFQQYSDYAIVEKNDILSIEFK